MTQNALYFSRFALPIHGEPIQDAALWVYEGRLRYVGPRDDLDFPRRYYDTTVIRDLGDTVVIPGFVNAHSHLELGFAKGLNNRAGFTTWIGDLLALKKTSTGDTVLEGVQTAAHALAKSGVTALADHVSPDGPFEAILNTDFTGRLFIEVLGTERSRAQHAFDKAEHACTDWQKKAEPRFTLHASPHSAHALDQSVFEKTIEAGHRFSIHLHESEDEMAYFTDHSGPMAEFVDRLGGQAPIQTDFPRRTPIAAIAAYVHDHPLLVIHANIVTDDDLQKLNKTRHVIVHCPNSHAYFSHPRFPLERILSHGFTVALGTDSWASNRSQDFLDELRRMRLRYPELPDLTLLQMATVNGAIGLGLENEIGTLEVGKWADLIGFPYTGKNPYQAIFEARACTFRTIAKRGLPLTGFTETE